MRVFRHSIWATKTEKHINAGCELTLADLLHVRVCTYSEVILVPRLGTRPNLHFCRIDNFFLTLEHSLP